MAASPINGAASAKKLDDINTVLKELFTDLFGEMQKPAKEINQQLIKDRYAQIVRILTLNGITKTPISDEVLATIPVVLRCHLLEVFLMTVKVALK